jgi:hypothetical protein
VAYMIHGVVVVPQETPALRVGIVVVLVLPWRDDVLCPSVPRRSLYKSATCMSMRTGDGMDLTEGEPCR